MFPDILNLTTIDQIITQCPDQSVNDTYQNTKQKLKISSNLHPRIKPLPTIKSRRPAWKSYTEKRPDFQGYLTITFSMENQLLFSSANEHKS